MKLHRHMSGLLAAVAALPWAASVHGQYAPYGQIPQQYSQPAPQQYQTPYPAYQAPQGQAPAYGYGQPAQPRVAMRMQNGQPAGDLSLTPPSENVAPGAAQPNPAPQAQAAPSYSPTPTPAYQPVPAESYSGYVPGMEPTPAPAPGCNCNAAGAAPMAYEGYGAPAAGYAGCDAGYGGGAYGSCMNGYSTYNGAYGATGLGGQGGSLFRPAGCNYWFGGVYGLLMQRDNADKVPLVFAASGLAAGAYPTSDQVVLTTRNVDLGYQGGVEFRFGRTFGGGAGGGCGCCTPPCWGLEGVYWQLFDSDASAQYVQSGTLRVYTMRDFRGLEYDPGTGYRPLNHYFDYGPPVSDYTNGGALAQIRVDLAQVRSSFEVQNVEVNLLRLPLWGAGPYAAGLGAAAYGNCASGGCDAGGCDSCGGCNAGGCNAGGCGCGSRFSYTTLCGFRFMQFDESFMYGVNFTNLTTNATGFMNYNALTRNNLYGAQLGGNGLYRIGCKWGVNLGSSFGLYGNDIDVRQYFNSPTGAVRFIGTTENANIHAKASDVSMIGELRLGLSYQATCNCRLYGGWRAIGVTGIALATDQAPGAWIDGAQMNNYVNSNGSLILHGLQTGVTWNY